ncbi:MAG TPA: hypothetical protein VNX68_11935, partial [Nitrosopumilaceae archaeon]|nr:hypothetical protein [Nitrosopumilaceae archaeon]
GPAGLAKAGALTKAAKAVPQAAKIAGVGTLGARAVKELGGGELAQEGTKLGLMLATGLQGSRKVLENRLDTNYQTLEKLATGATQDASKLRNVVRTVRSDVEKGIQTTEKKTVSNLLNEVNDSIYKGRQGISVAEAVELDKDINEILRDRSTSPKIKKQLSKVQDGLSGVLEDYGERNKPWLNVYRETKDLDNGFNNRSVINDFLQNEVSLEGRLKSSIGKNLVFGGVFGSGLYNLGAKSLASVPVAIGLRESVKMAEFLRNSKVARKYYVDTMNAALSNNKNAFAQAASKLDKVAEKYEEKHPSEKRYRIIRAT